MAAIALFCALVLGLSAAHKIMASERTGAAAARLAGVPLVQGRILSFAAAATEGAGAIALLFSETRPLGAGLGAALWAAYAVLLWRQRGRSLDCGCSFGRREKKVGLSTVARPAGLAVLAVAAALLPSAVVTVEAIFSALAFFVLYLALDELMAIPQPAWRQI